VTFSNRTETVAKGRRKTVHFFRPLNENVVYVRGQIPLDEPGSTEDVTMHNPAGLFVAMFKEALARQGIKIAGKVRTLNWLDRQVAPMNCDTMVELGSVESPPLRTIAREIMKPSQNLYTDLLLAHIGERARSSESSSSTSEDLGIIELNKFLGETGVPAGEVLFEEGSGLSRNNLTTPNATIRLLQFMSQRPYATAFVDSLPIAGVDGTLRGRMRGTAAASNVRAKTGTLRWANSLSGFVTTRAGERLAFSIMLNRYRSPEPNRPARPEIDAIAVMLAGFAGTAQ
jgi:D-alanyl-D-alanine carboxypeptidase/D-alanyl-D-alanine-endopeptidase (penicillin-binding protein 4)